MASVEQEPRTNGSAAGAGERPHIEVENPATGAGHRARCPTSAPTRSPTWPRRARAAQPGWEALGFEGRGADHAAARRSG